MQRVLLRALDKSAGAEARIYSTTMLGTGCSGESYRCVEYLIRQLLGCANCQGIPKLEAGARCGVIADIGAFQVGC